jgi:F-type H+-transporting ATPase subunit b
MRLRAPERPQPAVRPKAACRNKEALAEETAARMADFVARRTKQAQTKIALAEAQATADVRAAAAEAATKAAEIVLKSTIKGAAAADLVTQGIEDLKRLMH